MKHTTKLLVIIATAVSTVAFAGAGWAYWATTGAGTASATVGTLAAPIITTPVTATGSTVSLAWSAVPAPGTGSVRYFVLRDNAAASIACGTSTSPIAGTSCSDTSVPNGLHSYTVTAKFQSWTATSASASVTVNGDTVPPTVTINQAVGQSDPTNNGTVNFTAVFSESVTDFTGADVAVSGTAQLSSIIKTVTGGPSSYTVAVSGVTGNGTVTATVPAGGALDPAGNANLVSTSTDNTVTLDTTAPTVTINQAAGQADPTNSGTVNFTVAFSEPVTGFTNPDVTIGGGGTGGTKTAAVTGGPTTYNVAVTGATGNGTVTAAVTAGAAQDAAGNASSASTSTDNTVTLDTTAPAVANVTLANNATLGSAVDNDTLTVLYSEQMDATKFCSSWTGVGSKSLSGNGDVTVTITENGTNDTLTVSSATCPSFKFGSVALGGNYVAATRTFSGNGSNASTITWDPTAKTLTITLGNGSGSVNSSVPAGTPSYTPASGLADIAGNVLSTSAVNGTPTSRF